MATLRTIHVYYEHPDWFRPLFAELDRRGVDYVRAEAGRFAFDPDAIAVDPPPLVLNRMSPSAWKRGRGHAILNTLHYLACLERAGVPVVNGLTAFTIETSKALQVALIEGIGLRAPRSRVVNHPTVLPRAARELAFPLVVKPNIGGSGAGIARFDTRAELEAAIEQDAIAPSLDGVLVLQEFHPPAGDHIVRVETLNGRYFYGIRVHIGQGAGFNLCPAELCTAVGGRALASTACPAGAAAVGLEVEGFEPPDEIKREVERIAREAGLDVGGIEYLESARDGQRYYYDVNALSNFVPDPLRVVGFDPTARFVDYVLGRAVARRPAARRGSAVRRRVAAGVAA